MQQFRRSWTYFRGWTLIPTERKKKKEKGRLKESRLQKSYQKNIKSRNSDLEE